MVVKRAVAQRGALKGVKRRELEGMCHIALLYSLLDRISRATCVIMPTSSRLTSRLTGPHTIVAISSRAASPFSQARRDRDDFLSARRYLVLRLAFRVSTSS